MIWKTVVGAPAYEVSRKGDVRRKGKALPLKPYTSKTGHASVSVGKRRPVHRLVVEAFIGPIPDGYHVNHLNSRPGDNRVANLEIASPMRNSKHGLWSRAAQVAKKLGLKRHGDRLVFTGEGSRIAWLSQMAFDTAVREIGVSPAAMVHGCRLFWVRDIKRAATHYRKVRGIRPPNLPKEDTRQWAWSEYK